MPRIARVTVPSVPHHITQRGNRRQKTFFSNKDYAAYIEQTHKLTKPLTVNKL